MNKIKSYNYNIFCVYTHLYKNIIAIFQKNTHLPYCSSARQIHETFHDTQNLLNKKFNGKTGL